jgi:glucose/arabinose dehydrogenase
MRNVCVVAAIVCALAGCLAIDDDGLPLIPAPDSLALELVAQGLFDPVFVTSPRADSARLFVVEQAGRIRIIRRDTLLARIFLDIRGSVLYGPERGLLSMAFHPNYATNGQVFVYYTNADGDIRVVRYDVSTDPDSLDPLSGDTILAVPHPVHANHNGGQLAFGRDGYLYVSLGDGGGGGDPNGNGQNLGALLGKILRLDVNGALPYAIPANNPFVGVAGARGEIWAYGLRNPWRFSFDRGPSGDLYIGDVGQNAREEVNAQPGTSSGGENYGWNIMEGTQCFGGGSCNSSGLVLPVVDYPNPADGCAVTGGYVYRGSRAPLYRGFYFYADHCSNLIRSFRLVNGQVTNHIDWSGVLSFVGNINSFGEDARGELYIVPHAGFIYRLISKP